MLKKGRSREGHIEGAIFPTMATEEGRVGKSGGQEGIGGPGARLGTVKEKAVKP